MKTALGWFLMGLCMNPAWGSRPVVQKLRTYCAACHALGDMRFITSDSDDEVWRFLFENRAPRSGKLWSEGIRDVLNWPTEAPPPFDSLMVPPHQDWMPKGRKRLLIAEDKIGEVPARRAIRDALLSPLSETDKNAPGLSPQTP